MGHRIRWAAKIPQHLLKKFYSCSGLGIIDEELIDDVGLRLYLRCESIVMITQKAFFCSECGNKIFISITTNDSTKHDLSCNNCGSIFTAAEFSESYRHRDLWQGNAGIYFEKYYNTYMKCKSPNEKIIMIDTLIHSFHMDAKTRMPNRAAGNNLIEGSLSQVVTLLNELSGIQPDNDVLFEETASLMWQRRKGLL